MENQCDKIKEKLKPWRFDIGETTHLIAYHHSYFGLIESLNAPIRNFTIEVEVARSTKQSINPMHGPYP